jgi:hypothetical protein
MAKITVIINPTWTAAEPQYYQDSWREGRIRRLDYTGRCVYCNRRTYAFEDGENDPRGIIGDRAGSPLYAPDYDSIGPSVPLCFACANEEDSYTIALVIARALWTRKEVEATK